MNGSPRREIPDKGINPGRKSFVAGMISVDNRIQNKDVIDRKMHLPFHEMLTNMHFKEGKVGLCTQCWKIISMRLNL